MTDQDAANLIQDTLMEPRDNGADYPSGLWSPDEVWAAMNERQNRFLKASLFQVGTASIPVTAGVSRYALPQDWLTTIAVVWRGQNGYVRALERSDSFEADHGMPTWETTRGTPLLYFDEDQPLLQIALAPLPERAGTLDLIYVGQGPTLTGQGELLMLPAEYAHAVAKYGTLADLFGKDGRGANPEKAAYCELRYQMAEQMSQILLNGFV